MFFVCAIATGFTVGALCFVVFFFVGPIGSVHRSIDGSFFHRKIIVPLYHTSQFVLVNKTSHPALHRTLMPINNAMDSLGTTCPTSTAGSPGDSGLCGHPHRGAH